MAIARILSKLVSTLIKKHGFKKGVSEARKLGFAKKDIHKAVVSNVDKTLKSTRSREYSGPIVMRSMRGEVSPKAAMRPREMTARRLSPRAVERFQSARSGRANRRGGAMQALRRRLSELGNYF